MIIINMAKLPISRIQMVQAKVIQFLIKILDQRNKKVKDLTCSTALEKTVSKAAIALARLSQDSSTADMVIKLGGLSKLVNLAKLAPAHGDKIPMAVMVAIKTITSCCNVEHQIEIRESDVVESFA